MSNTPATLSDQIDATQVTRDRQGNITGHVHTSRSRNNKEPNNPATTANTMPSLTWQVGMRVEARYAGRQRYYSGIINWVRRAGDLFDVLYDDGDQEFYVKRHLIRPDSLKIGSKVLVRPANTGTGKKFTKGIVSAIDVSSLTCTVIFNNGTRETGVRRVMIVTTS